MEATVEILINEDTRTWNEDAIDGLFVPEEAALIKKKSCYQYTQQRTNCFGYGHKVGNTPANPHIDS